MLTKSYNKRLAVYILQEKTLHVLYRKAQEKFLDILPNILADSIIWAMISFFGGFISTQAMVFGNYAPFTIAFAASVPKKGLWAAVIGGLIGYMLPSPVYMPFRYMAALLALGAIRWALSEVKKVNTNILYAPIVSFLPLISTGLTMVLINNSMPNLAAMYLAESLMAAGASFFFSRTIYLLYNKKMRGMFDTTDLACISVSLSVLILSFNNFDIFGVSIGRMLMVLVILLCAGNGGIAGGAVSGVSIGAIVGLSSVGLSYLSGAYGLGGLMAGIFASVGKASSIVAFIVAHGIAGLSLGNEQSLLTSAIEVAIASIGYMFIPKSKFLSNMFSLKKESLSGAAIKNNILLRLKHASNALSDVSGNVNEISEKLAKSSKANIGQVYNKSASEICAGCSMRAVCWKKDRQATIIAFSSLTPVLKGKGKVKTDDFKPYLKERCGRIGEMRESVNKFYKNYMNKQAAEIRAAQVRDIAEEQFKITSAMLEDLAKEFSLYRNFDEEASQRISAVFKNYDIYPIDVCCRTDNHGRMTVEAELTKAQLNGLNKTRLTREISKACGRVFALPCISNTEERCKIQMCQKPLLDVKVGIAQESAGNFCGDSVVGFYDGQGRYIALVSDGMGTGGMAAVDGTMACSITEILLKAGIGYETVLRLVNSALMSKSEEETLATMDIAAFDLFSGKCEFRKAGATGSVIRKGKYAQYVERDSLPVGIMKEVEFAVFSDSFKKGDIIVLMSDGVTVCGHDWVCETVEGYSDNDPEKLAKDIVGQAKKSRNDGRRDDISALVIIIGGEDESKFE